MSNKPYRLKFWYVDERGTTCTTDDREKATIVEVIVGSEIYSEKFPKPAGQWAFPPHLSGVLEMLEQAQIKGFNDAREALLSSLGLGHVRFNDAGAFVLNNLGLGHVPS